jgi:hypothetical protein
MAPSVQQMPPASAPTPDLHDRNVRSYVRTHFNPIGRRPPYSRCTDHPCVVMEAGWMDQF